MPSRVQNWLARHPAPAPLNGNPVCPCGNCFNGGSVFEHGLATSSPTYDYLHRSGNSSQTSSRRASNETVELLKN